MERILKIGLIGAMMLGISAAGCVEDDQSVVMLGSVIGAGEVDEETDTTSCSFAAEMEDTPMRTTGFIDLNHLGSQGQPLVAGSSEGTVDRYDFIAVFENRLFDSRTVGATSGGSGGGYTNLPLDKNDIFINSVTVRYPSSANTFATDGGGSASLQTLTRERLSNMLVLSGGGVATLDIPLINGSQERQFFESFLSDELGMNDEPVTFVVEIQLHGETLAGNEISSNRIEYPITMCGDCGSTTDALCSLE